MLHDILKDDHISVTPSFDQTLRQFFYSDTYLDLIRITEFDL